MELERAFDASSVKFVVAGLDDGRTVMRMSAGLFNTLETDSTPSWGGETLDYTSAHRAALSGQLFQPGVQTKMVEFVTAGLCPRDTGVWDPVFIGVIEGFKANGAIFAWFLSIVVHFFLIAARISYNLKERGDCGFLTR